VSDREQARRLTADGPPRSVLIAGVAVAIAAVIVVLVIAVQQRRPQQQPQVIPAVPAPQAETPECHALLAVLPQRLGDYQRLTPVPPGTAAWRTSRDPDPIVLRCGLDRPSDFVVGAAIQVVDAVQWFQAPDPGGSRATWFAVDRPVYVALTLPQGTGPTPIQQISEVISATMPPVPIRPGPPS
jgi:hypothetical protein